MEMALQPGCMNVHVYVCTVCTICTADARRSFALPFALPVETVVRRPRDALLRYPDVACVALPVALFPKCAVAYLIQSSVRLPVR